jgi:arylsulfatase
MIHNAYFIYAAQTGVAKFLATFKEFPPAQHPGSFTVEDAHAALENAASGANH